jgi:hypothetical protein
MYGRYLDKLPVTEIARSFGTRNALPNYPERLNIPPTDPVLNVRFNPETKGRSLDALPWGPGAVLGEGSEDRLEDDQRACLQVVPLSSTFAEAHCPTSQVCYGLPCARPSVRSLSCEVDKRADGTIVDCL